jgi:hypothetical protein
LPDAPPRPASAPASCPNCGAPAGGAFCAACGQDSRSPRRDFGSLVAELLGSFFAFDGRVWRSLVPLFLRPGRLTRAWMDGRRAAFVPPLRLFLCFSILLFLVIQCRTPTADLLLPEAGPADPAAPAADTAPAAEAGGFHLEIGLPGFWPFTRLAAAIEAQEVRLGHMRPEARRYVLARRAMELAPIALLLLLPLLALFLKLWWLGTGSFYLDHLVLLLHAYAFVCGFAVLLILVPLPTPAIVLGSLAIVPYHFHRAMSRVYGRGFARTLLGTLAGMAVTFAALLLVAFVLLPYGVLTV